MSGYTRQQAVLWQNAVALADRRFRIAMVRLGWDEVRGEKTMLRNPPKDWQLADPFPSTQVKAKIDEGCNAYLYRLPDEWWVVDADTAELVAEYTGLLGAPDIVTPRGAHWVVDAPAQSRHKLDTGVRGFYGPGSHYLGPDGHLREYTGAVPAAPRPLPAALRRPAAEYGQLAPGELMVLEPGAARHTVEKFRAAWLASVHGGRHVAMRDYLPQLARLLRAEGSGWDEVAEQLQQAVEAHPGYDPGWFGAGSATGVLHFALTAAATTPWRLEGPAADTLEARFAPPDPAGAPATSSHVDWGDDDDPDVLTDADYDGEWDAPIPALLDLGGPVRLLYQGDDHTPRTNILFGAPGCGKTWLALTTLVQVAESGQRCWYVDYENSRPELVARMKALGLSREGARLVTYTRASAEDPRTLHERMKARGGRYGLMVLDGWNAALRSMSVDENSTGEVTGWYQRWVVSIPTVVILDHVAKGGDGFSEKTAIGSQAKGAVLSGISWFVEKTQGFGTQSSGALRLTQGKDRPGGIEGRFQGGRVLVDVKVGDGGRKVRLEMRTLMGEPVSDEEAMFDAMYADGLSASLSERDFVAEWRLRSKDGKAPGKTRVATVRQRWQRYWGERENAGSGGPRMDTE